MDAGFGYLAVLRSDGSGEITSIIADWISSGPFKAVIWSVPRGSWIYAPAVAVRYVFDDQYFEKRVRIDRPQAEKIARELGTELPTEQTLRELCAEGEREGWDFGPPRTR